MNLFKAVKAFWHTLCNGETAVPTPLPTPVKPAETEAVRTKTPEKKATRNSADTFEAGAVYTLTLLQREGRLVDFLMENIETYDDAQIGAAVRRIHHSCGKTLEEYFRIRKIIDNPEGSGYSVDTRLDRSKIRLVGNVPDMLPFEGVVQHGGWEAGKVDLPERNDSVDIKVIYPAEVGF